MPAYVQHHQDIEIAPVICPTSMGFLPIYVREVEPHWSLAKIDFVYECADCGTKHQAWLGAIPILSHPRIQLLNIGLGDRR